MALIVGRAAAPMIARLPAANEAPVLLHCADRSKVDDVLVTFEDIPQVKAVGLRGITLTEQTEVAQVPKTVQQERLCAGIIEASNTEQYDKSYGFEIVQGRLIVRVALR